MDIKKLDHKDVDIEKRNLKAAADLWEAKYKRTVKLCKAIEQYRPYVGDIKGYLSLDDDLGASELWNELDYPVQKLLITAPRFGGPFTTAEVKKIKSLWDISVEDIEK